MAERTGSLVFSVLWSYVKELVSYRIHIECSFSLLHTVDMPSWEHASSKENPHLHRQEKLERFHADLARFRV
ncbi:hypothetical protein PSPO01_05037 [Paraphaeosphaeria sporulosa]